MPLNHRLKIAFETLLLNRIWLEPSADLSIVARFVEDLRPVDVGLPLVRIGPKGDGGYLVPDDFEGLRSCVSPGVSTEVGFDLAMAEMGLPIFMADASVAGPPIDHPNFSFIKKYLDVHEDDSNMRLDTMVSLMPPEMRKDSILQMDIEGAEYRVLLDTSDETLQNFRIILLECHYLTRLFSRHSGQLIIAAFRKLLRHFDIVHIHPNNVWPTTRRGNVIIPPVMEFTLLRKDRARAPARRGLRFPHLLDIDNVSTRKSLVLPECWQ